MNVTTHPAATAATTVTADIRTATIVALQPTKRPRSSGPLDVSSPPKRTREDVTPSDTLSMYTEVTEVISAMGEEVSVSLYGTRGHRRPPDYRKTMADIAQLCLTVMTGLMGDNLNMWEPARVMIGQVNKTRKMREKQKKRSSFTTKTASHVDASAYITQLMDASAHFQSESVEATTAIEDTATVCAFRKRLTELQDRLDKAYACSTPTRI